MPRTLLQTAGTQNAASSATVSCSFGGGTTSGSEVIVAVTSGGGGLSTPTYTVSDGTNSYTSCTGSRVVDSSIHQATEIFHFNGVGAGITTITATASISTKLSIAAGEFSGSDPTTPFDNANGTTGSNTSPTVSVVSGSAANMVVSAVGDRGLNTLTGQTLTIPSGWTTIFNAGSNGSSTTSIGFAWQTIAGAGVPQAVWTESPSVAWSCNIASFNTTVDALMGQGCC